METAILAEIPSPTQGVWHLGPLPIRAYALCIVLGIIAACVVTETRMRRRGGPQGAVLDIAVFAVPFGIVGARLYHVITSPAGYFGAQGHLIDALKIWQGGLGIWGGVAGGAFGAWLAARRMGIPLTFVADALAPGMPLAQAIGRWGNWFNNELYGRPTSLPWGLKIYEWDPTAGRAVTETGTGESIVKGVFQPTFLYESLWDLGVALLVWQLDRRYRFGRGRAFAVYVMAYTVGRFWIEALRSDEATHILGMRLNDWTSIIVFLGALLYFLRARGPREYLVAGPDGTFRTVDDGAAVGSDGAAVGSDGGPVADDLPVADASAVDQPAADAPAVDGRAADGPAPDDAEPVPSDPPPLRRELADDDVPARPASTG